jgi:hypothetical protein
MRVPGCRRWYVAFCALYWALVAPWSGAHAAGLDFADSAWSRAAHDHGLDPALLYALTLVESRRSLDGDRVGPWPWVIRTPRDSYWFESRARARKGLKAVLAEWPAKRVDVGAAQVNVGWHRARFDRPAQLLDLETNLRVAAAILADAIASTQDTVVGVGRYHHWGDAARSRHYGQRVWWTYRAITFGQANPAGRFSLPSPALGGVAAREGE